MKRRTLAFAVSFLLATSLHAEYVGLEPERLARLLEALPDEISSDERLAAALAAARADDWEAAESQFRRRAETDAAARLGWVVSLFHLGRKEDALEAAESGIDSPELRFARVLLRLHADRGVSFRALRAELVSLGLEAEDRFDLWLALNPPKDELEVYLKRLGGAGDPNLRLRKAEIYLRLNDPKKARAELEGAAARVEDTRLRSRMDLIHARALFELGSDRAGQAHYERVLDRLDPGTAERLYRELAPVPTREEREEYNRLAPEDRKEFFRSFWARRHPVPSQHENPRLAEHYRRLGRAIRDYPLQSTGRGYFVDEEVFLSLSPRLPHYDPTRIFEEGRAAGLWVDHRGLILLRHGEPDRRLPERTYGGSDPAASWLISRFRSQPLAFHFVKRPPIGEWTLVLNLGVAATRPAAPDAPREVVQFRTRDLGPLYASRRGFLALYQQILNARSIRDVEEGLYAESRQMSAFAGAALSRDTTAYYTEENTIPLVASAANFYHEGRPAVQVDFAADLEVLEKQATQLRPGSELVLTVLVYDRQWKEALRREQRSFPLGEKLPDEEGKVFLGSINLHDLEPEEYRLVLELRQPDTGRLGLARGRHVPVYIPPDHLGLSDLFLRAGARRDGEAWIPVPSRVVRKEQPVRVEFELYHPKPDASGLARYEIEERVLTLYKQPGFWSQLASIGSQVAGGFFPLYTFAAHVGAFTLSQALVSDDAGLVVNQRVVERPAEERVTESLQIDLSDLDKGVHTVYVTVRDLVTGEVTSRFLTLQVS